MCFHVNLMGFFICYRKVLITTLKFLNGEILQPFFPFSKSTHIFRMTKYIFPIALLKYSFSHCSISEHFSFLLKHSNLHGVFLIPIIADFLISTDTKQSLCCYCCCTDYSFVEEERKKCSTKTFSLF